MGFVTDQRDLIFLKPANEQPLKHLQGSLKGKGGLKPLMDERRKDKEINMAVKVLVAWG
jgi:hypothetical protein